MNYISRGLSFIVLAPTVTLSGCGDRDISREHRASVMEKKQPSVEIAYSTDRENINKRLKIKNDQTRITWVYCLNEMGGMVFNSPAVGGITSSNKRLEPSVTVQEIYGSNGHKNYDLIGADGTYGSSDSYVFWFTPEGQYCKWNGLYLETDFPIKLDRPVLNVRDIDYQELQRAKNAETALKTGKKITNKLEVEVNQ